MLSQFNRYRLPCDSLKSGPVAKPPDTRDEIYGLRGRADFEGFISAGARKVI